MPMRRRRTSLPGLAAAFSLASLAAASSTWVSVAVAQPAPGPAPAPTPSAPPATSGTTAPTPAPAAPPSAGTGTAAPTPAPAAAPTAPVTAPEPSRAPLVEDKASDGSKDPSAGPTADAAASGSVRAAAGPGAVKPADVYAEDWWSHTRPMFEMHGYYRVRAELFHNFALGRADSPNDSLWNQPIDRTYRDRTGVAHEVNLCYSDPGAPAAGKVGCENKTQSGANMRLRLDPEIHISDNLRIVTQIDLFDNLVLGSTPASNYTTLSNGATVVGGPNPYVPLGAFATTQDVPSAGQNGFSDSIRVKRAYGEYTSPVGVLRFGRMANQWGLGILANAGDTYDSDWQSNVDRIMFITGIRSLDLYFAGAWDFPNEGATSATAFERSGQPYDLGQLDDVNQYVLTAVRRINPDIAKQQLSRGKPVFEGGLFAVYRSQYLANDSSGTPSADQVPGQGHDNLQSGLVRRNAKAFIPDLWGRVRYKKFRFEIEALTVQGSMENTLSTAGGNNYASSTTGVPNGWKLRQYLVAAESEYRAVEDKLKIGFGFGWASGDPDIGEDGPSGLAPRDRKLQIQRTNDRNFSMGRFHPNYRVDLILFRNIMTRVQGAYYFRPSVDYDFIRHQNGQKIGGGAAIIWSRASEFVQSPGHKRDLGVELDLSVYYQAKDGSLNDSPDKMGGFYTMIQYGVLFPLGGLGYQPGEKSAAALQGVGLDTSAAQILRWYTGIMF
jgi:uncharacterized protein (TIGR04551 family)